jgi:peptide chain release factor 1
VSENCPSIWDLVGRSRIRKSRGHDGVGGAAIEHRLFQETGDRESAIERGAFAGVRPEAEADWIGLTLYNLDRFMEGDLDEMIQSLQTADLQERLKESAITA